MKQHFYMAQPLEMRQQHVDLHQPCLYRGGTSQHHKGVLAQFLDTEIYGRPVDLCHKCGNGECSNPRHLYWGTRSENVQDAITAGTMKSMWIKLVEKVGLEEARNQQRTRSNDANRRRQKEGLEHPHTGTTIINDGVVMRRWPNTIEIPSGWVRGRIQRKRS